MLRKGLARRTTSCLLSTSANDRTMNLARWLDFNEKGLQAYRSKDYANAKTMFSLAMELRKSTRDTCFAASMSNLALVHLEQQDLKTAYDLLEEAVDILDGYPEVEKANLIRVNSLLDLGDVCFYLEKFQQSKEAFEEAHQFISEEMQNKIEVTPHNIARCRFGFGRALHQLRNLDSAAEMYQSCLDLLRELHPDGKSHNISEALRSLAVVNAERGKSDDAKKFYIEAMETLVVLNSKMLPMVIVEYADYLGHLGEDELAGSIADVVGSGVADQLEAIQKQKEQMKNIG
eukprot:TRINITY_DN6023_c0_g1_i1.p1 TRINITY_DN6023_c0_g1~~TRINITY_DN6023_c0_g1_i1.p1  ORF type:complete len:289 (+),score=86.07 TRINITY_DN6023_c0_g1_i1:70-936(+)